MIRIGDIQGLFDYGWRVNIGLFDKQFRKGMCCPTIETIVLFPLCNESNEDLDITLMHELIHASYPKVPEQRAEDFAKLIVWNCHTLVDYAKTIFSVKDYEDYIPEF